MLISIQLDFPLQVTYKPFQLLETNQSAPDSSLLELVLGKCYWVNGGNMLVFCKLNAVCAVLLNTSWLPGFTLTPLCLLSRRAGCQQYVLKSMSNPWCLRIELVWATLQKASISSYFSRSVLWVTLQMIPQGQLTAITISAQLKGALPLLGEILVHLKVSFWHRQLTQKGDSVCLAAALALTIFKFYSSISCHKKCPTLAMGKTAKKVYTQWGKKKKRESELNSTGTWQIF